jgi:uncharacterized protein (TIGR03437 family)
MTRSIALIFFATALFADTSETAYFRGVMLPSNETPPVSIAATGNATLIAHIVRDDSGKIISGAVDFNINHAFPGAVTLTGLHIHSGAAGVAGPVTIGTDLSGTNSIVSQTGVGSIAKQAPAITQAALDTLTGMMRDPSQYYVNLHSTESPSGVIRGQLQRADVTVLMGLMSPANETPPIDSTATGVSHVTVIATRNASGAYTSGQVIFDINFNFGKQTTISGFHIHAGKAGIAGPVTINTGINGTTASVVTDATGAATLRRTAEVDVTRADQLDTLYGLFTHPKDYYINMHTLEFGGGLIRDQLRTTDTIPFNVTMLPSNETPPVAGLDASAPSQVIIRTIRAEDGTVLAGTATFDVNYRFPAAHVEFTGLHVHDGAAGVAGPVRLNSALGSANPVVSETGFGNIFLFATMSNPNEVATLNSLVQNPERHYLNLHTSVNPGGVVRAQLTPANTALPVVTRGGNAANGATAAAGGLISIFGTSLAKISNDISGWQGTNLPTTFDGVKVTIGGKNAPLLYVSPGQINAQVPVDVAAGPQPVIVTSPNGASTATNITIAATAPAVFADLSDPARAIVEHQNFQLVGPDAPAKAGELLIIWATGLGQTTPAMTTGALVSFPPQADTAPVTVTIGGQDARVVYSIAAPGAVGIYQIAVTMPSGVTVGNAAVVVKQGTASSAPVNIAVQ